MDEVLFAISIQPIMTNGQSGNAGKYLTLNLPNGAGSQNVDSIVFWVCNGGQIMQLSYQGQDVTADYSQPVFMSIDITNNLFNPVGQSTFTIVIDSGSTPPVDDPIMDLFREGDIFTVSYQPSTPGGSTAQQIFVGTIESIETDLSTAGTPITLNVGYLTNILARSQLVQTQSQQQSQGTIFTSITSQLLQFGSMLDQLFSETYISQTKTQTVYYQGQTAGVNETLATGLPKKNAPTATNGSAINDQSYVFILTPPTGSKLDCIMQTIYPYQRVFYVDGEANFNITPLSFFFDPTENWSLDMIGNAKTNPSLIPVVQMHHVRNTTVIQNRAYSTLNQFFTQFILANNNQALGGAAAAISVATPPQLYFPRAYDFVQSGLGLQTSFEVEGIDGAGILQNSGLLNTAINLGNGKVTGLQSVMIIDNGNANIKSGTVQDDMKFITSLYSARKLAENLFQDLLVDFTVPTVSTYMPTLNRFKKLPINQVVNIPQTNNKMFDNFTQMFCYGYSIRWNQGGTTTTLNLCKPNTFTALWAAQVNPITTT